MSPTSSPAMSSATKRASIVLSPLRRTSSHSGRVFRCLLATSSSSVLRCFCRTGGCARQQAPRADPCLLLRHCSRHVSKPPISGSSGEYQVGEEPDGPGERRDDRTGLRERRDDPATESLSMAPFHPLVFDWALAGPLGGGVAPPSRVWPWK